MIVVPKKSKWRYLVVSIIGGILFGVMDGLINANPFAQTLYAVYQSIAKTSLDIYAGLVIDLAYGFILAGIFLILYASLPGETGLVKGISFAALVWFLRVVMSVASSWLMFQIPVSTLAYILVTGFIEMLILGILFGLALKSEGG